MSNSDFKHSNQLVLPRYGLIGKASLIVVIFSLFYFLLPPTQFNEVQTSQILFAVLAIVMFLFFLGDKRVSQIYVIPIFLLLGLIFFSATYSDDPALTVRDGIFFFFLYAFSVLVAAYQSTVRVALFCILASLLIINLYLFVFESLYAVFFVTSFMGIYENPNSLAFVVLSCLPAVLSIRFSNVILKLVKFLLILLSFLLILFTKSDTALFTFCVVLLCWLLILLLIQQKQSQLFRAAVITFISTALALTIFLLVLAIQLNPTISGRTVLWESVILLIQDNWLLGQGWSTAWPLNSEAFIYMQSLSSPLQHAHNESLNWLLTLGLIGLLFSLFIYVTMFFIGVRLIKTHKNEIGMWVILSCVAFFVRGLTDISETNPQGWFVLMLALSAGVHELNISQGKRISFLWWPVPPLQGSRKSI